MGTLINYVESSIICDPKIGLLEPSGLALTPDGQGLWTVSDDTPKVFRLDLKGKLVGSFGVRESSLEGLATDRDGLALYAVQEGTNVLLKYPAATRLDKTPVESLQSKPLSELKGYGAVKKDFEDDKDDNKGLEGITVNTSTGNLFILKEGSPGLLMEVTPDFRCLRDGHRRLRKKNGFIANKNVMVGKKIDFSGICYDANRNAFWIVSDKAKRVYLYSWDQDKVIEYDDLDAVIDGRKEFVPKAEGVAYDAYKNRLYVVSDVPKNGDADRDTVDETTVRLYVYDVAHRHFS